MTQLNSVDELVADLRAGKMVILMDDEDRENEGDLVMAASCVTPEAINFMATHARGLICLTLTRERCAQLGLPLMVSQNEAKFSTAFTTSIEAAKGVTTGISAGDRATTVQAAVAQGASAADIVQPGHIFPIQARDGGVLVRAGHTEAGCDLARLAGFEPAAVIVEIMNENGTMARRPDLEAFAKHHELKIGTIADLIDYRLKHEKTVERMHSQTIETRYGEFELIFFRDLIENQTHVAMVKGDLTQVAVPTVRVHVANPLRDLMYIDKSDASGWSMDRVLEEISRSDAGVVLLLGDSFGPMNMVAAAEEFIADHENAGASGHDQGVDEEAGRAEAEYRTIGTGSQILKELGVKQMRLLSSPTRFHAISGFDLEIVECAVYDR